MRAFAACGLAVAAWLIVCAGDAGVSARQAQVFRTATQTVPVYATVTDAAGRLVTDLTRDQFQILDNGRPQPVTVFDNTILPISIVVMLDTSGSMAGNLARLRAAAVQLFTRLLPDDKARVGNFGDRIQLSPAFTNDVDELIRTLWLDIEPGGGTPLWGAVNVGMSALARLDGRRVVLVLSDGKDTGAGFGRPSVSLDTVIKRAQTEDFLIYAIGMRSSGGVGRAWRGPGRGGFGFGSAQPDPGLAELALESGGFYFELKPDDDLGTTFARVADELHRQYELGFRAPENDGRLHQIEVRVTAPGLSVRARKSYLAPRPR